MRLASSSEWQERVSELENKLATQATEMQNHIDAIATLENQKLDLMQGIN